MTAKEVSPKLDEDAVKAEYARTQSIYKDLCNEVRYILERAVAATQIKIHAIEDRVKTCESLIKKAKERGSKFPLGEIHDVAGLRVICLFRDDLATLENLIRSNFEILSKDDKIESGGAVGYQSIHYVCALPNTIAGPRYDHIVTKKFEVQIRTLCMHCWATVSHYIDYKGDWDVPNDLKKSLSALSGLFYVADNEFQQFNIARLQSKKSAEADVSSRGYSDAEINLDTMWAYIDATFPARKNNSPSEVSELVLDIKKAGYELISEVDADIKRAAEAFAKYEQATQGGPHFNAVGVIRLSLVLGSEKFSGCYYAESPVAAEGDDMFAYRVWGK